MNASVGIEGNKIVDLSVRKAKIGDKEAFSDLIRVNKVAMYRVAKSILKNEEDVEDAISEAILKAFKNIKSLKEESYFKTWLLRIVINESNNIYKKRNKEVVVERDTFINMQTSDKYKDFTLYDAINSLEEDLRVTTILFYFEDMKYRDIASVLNVKEGTVKSRLSRAKEKLYSMLRGDIHG